MRKPIFADISLLFVTFIWGTTFVLVQNAISLLDPFSFNGIRFLAAAVMLLLWLFLFERKQIALLNLKMLAYIYWFLAIPWLRYSNHRFIIYNHF
jgi:drug/metabolite transporter (DMT)-like permease